MTFNQPARQAHNNLWPVIVIAAFAVVYLFSLTFVYVEGDDASSIAHHLLGRNTEVQPPYSPYHAMMDQVLSLLPRDEQILRMTAMSMTAAAAPVLVILILALAFGWAKGQLQTPRMVITVVLLLALPEVFYLGLVYIPSVIAMTLVVASHVVVRRALARAADYPDSRMPFVLTLCSIILFGLGAACRWDTAVYGGVIVADLFVGSLQKPAQPGTYYPARFRFGLLWGMLAITVFLIAITLTGYSPMTILASIDGYNNYLSAIEYRMTDFVGSLQALLTPAFAVFVLVGVITLIRRRDSFLIVVIIGLLLVAPWAARGVPKFILPALPGLVACAVIGLDQLWTRVSAPARPALLRPAIALFLLAPWLLGVHVIYQDSAFGPGFEQRPYNRPDVQGMQVALVLGEGTLFPTPEGPRPLWGHAAVLLGGAWRSEVNKSYQEIVAVTNQAIEQNLPLVAASRPGYFTVELWREGLVTDDPRDLPGRQDFVERHFVGAEGESLVMLQRSVVASEVENLPYLLHGQSSVVIYGYPRTLRRLYEIAPQALQPIGNNSAVLNLDMLGKAAASISPLIEPLPFNSSGS